MGTRKAVVLESLVNGDHHYLVDPNGESIDVDEKALARYPSKFDFKGKDEAIANLEAHLAEISADEEEADAPSNEEE